jgi:predicted nucleic acid-binding protein
VSTNDRAQVLVDTNVLGAHLTNRMLLDLYQPLMEGCVFAASFMTEVELRFGARKAVWGTGRRRELEQLLARTNVVWPSHGLARTYVELRLYCHRKGHPLAGRTHEADRWIAATALRLGVPLVTHDRVFAGVDGLDVLTRLH